MSFYLASQAAYLQAWQRWMENTTSLQRQGLEMLSSVSPQLGLTDDTTETKRPIATSTAKAAPKPKSPAATAPDDLTVIKGIGPVLSVKLNQLGIFTYEQIAALTSSDVARINGELSFKGRIERENWTEQAAALLIKSR